MTSRASLLLGLMAACSSAACAPASSSRPGAQKPAGELSAQASRDSSPAPAPAQTAPPQPGVPGEARDPGAEVAVEPAQQEPGEREAPAYSLDRVSRKVPIRGELHCPNIDKVRYRGEVVAFQKPLRVYAGFIEHLRRFEQIVRDTAIEIYGRPPAKIWVYGKNRCRRIRKWPYLLSEHALGNAIDIGAFKFARVRGEEAEGVPRRWRRSFVVNLSLHWRARKKREQIHSDFLRLLARRVIDSEGLFRTILGPVHPKHRGHFHFDMARERSVNVF